MAQSTPDVTVNDQAAFCVIEPLGRKEEQYIGFMDFLFSEWCVGGLIASQKIPNSWSFIKERLLSELVLGSLGASNANLKATGVVFALKEAFHATELNCNKALDVCTDELAALRVQLEQLDQVSVNSSLSTQQNFLVKRSESCKSTITRLSDCVTACIMLVRNGKEIYIASLGDYYAILVSANGSGNAYKVNQICVPHDLLNLSEHERLSAMNVSSSEMECIFGKGLPKFVRCFAGGDKKNVTSPLIAQPTISGPEKCNGVGFLALYNSSFHNTILNQSSPSFEHPSSFVPETIASNLFPLCHLSCGERKHALDNVMANWFKDSLAVAEPSGLYVRWFNSNNSSRPLAPLTIDVGGENSFRLAWGDAPEVVVAGCPQQDAFESVASTFTEVQAISRVENKPVSNETSNQQASSVVSTYVNLMPTNWQDTPLEKAFESHAKEALSSEELKILGLEGIC